MSEKLDKIIRQTFSDMREKRYLLYEAELLKDANLVNCRGCAKRIEKGLKSYWYKYNVYLCDDCYDRLEARHLGKNYIKCNTCLQYVIHNETHIVWGNHRVCKSCFSKMDQ